jgi:NIMA (never in mitosis gene a)-related kinase
MSLNDFEIIKRLGNIFLFCLYVILGEGAYSSVYHVRRIKDNEIYALKKVRMMKLSDKEKENALNEVRILASISHPNIVAYKEAFIDEPS